MNEREFLQTMELIVAALREKGYDPYKQLRAYITENDPGYITRHKNARNLVQLLNKAQVADYVARMKREAYSIKK